jgi:hypothetical protein
MKFLYLLQTESATPPCFEEIARRAQTDPDIDLLKLTFREREDGAVFYPGSTWTQGRNRLLEEAQALGFSPDYYVFCDDDLEVVHGSWAAFEDAIRRYKPALVAPYFRDGPEVDPSVASAVYDIDAMANAVHRDLIEDGILFPYHEGFDQVSWWLSQLYVIHLAAILYPGHVMVINALRVRNNKHREYPRLDGDPAVWRQYEEWVFQEILIDQPAARARFRRHYETYAFAATPATPLASYRLAPEVRSWLKPDGDYFKDRQALISK